MLFSMLLRARLAAALLTLAAAGSWSGLSGSHGHALGEVDLVAHALVAIGHAPATSEHFDRAVELEHPSCGACLLASLRSIRPPDAPPVLPISLSEVELAIRDEHAPRRLQARRAPARGPPFA